VKGFQRAKAIGLTIAVMAVVAGASFIGTNTALSTVRPKVRLIAADDFTISATISSSQSTETAAKLVPGVQRYVWYTATNPLSVSLTVTSMSIQSVTPPAGCPTAYLDTSNSSFSGSLVVPAHSTNGVGEPIKLIETGSSQDSCKNKAYGFTFTGSAQYTETYSTGTVLASSQNPSNPGQSVTYTATVTASATAGQDAVPSSPTGTVTFYDGSVAPANIIPGCSARPMTSTGTTTATATCVSPVYGSMGVHNIIANYANSDGNFNNSTGTMSQVVQAGNCLSSIPTSGSGVTVVTGTYSGNYTVNSGQTLYLNGGTITGNVTVNAGGKFVASGGTVKGNVNSSGPTSLQGTNVNGNIQASAPLALGANTVVGGNVQISGSGVTTLCLSGNSSGPVKVGKDLQVQQLPTSSTLASICNTQVSGNLQYTNNGTPVVIGGSAACRPNTVGGNLQVQNNTAQVTIGGSGFGNTAGGNIQVNNNTGSGTLTSNASTGGNCQLKNNTPGIVGSANTATGQNTCNGTA